MPKKPPKNAYFYFMLEYKLAEEKRGRYMNIRQVSDKCSGPWKNLPLSDKAKYEAIAKCHKNGDRNAAERYTTHGIAFSIIDNERQREEKKINDMHQKLVDIVEGAVLRKALATEEFVVITFNYFCMENCGRYIPAEIGIIKFNLKDGVLNNKLHLMIDPRVLPMGLAYTAKQHSDDTHKLKPPPYAMGEKNYETIFEEIRNFICPNNDGDFPALYTLQEHIPWVTSILKQFAIEVCHYEEEADKMFKIFSISELFYLLNKNTSQKPFNSTHIAKAMIDKDPYEYRPGLACQFHEDEDVPKFCAQSMVIRWAYTICDHICQEIDIKMVAGRHVPKDSAINYTTIDITNDDKDWKTVPSSFSGHDTSRDIKYDFDNESVTSSRFTKLTAPLSIKQEDTSLYRSSGSREKQLVENPFARNKETRDNYNSWNGAASTASKLDPSEKDYEWRAPPSSKYEDCETESNPWCVRSTRGLRTPLDSSMHFPSLSDVHRKPVTYPAMSLTSSNWSAGRGRLIMQREPSPPGTSSVVIKRELSASPSPPGIGSVNIKRELSSSPSLSPSPPPSHHSSIGRGLLIKREPSPLESYSYLERGERNVKPKKY